MEKSLQQLLETYKIHEITHQDHINQLLKSDIDLELLPVYNFQIISLKTSLQRSPEIAADCLIELVRIGDFYIAYNAEIHKVNKWFMTRYYAIALGYKIIPYLHDPFKECGAELD